MLARMAFTAIQEFESRQGPYLRKQPLWALRYFWNSKLTPMAQGYLNGWGHWPKSQRLSNANDMRTCVAIISAIRCEPFGLATFFMCETCAPIAGQPVIRIFSSVTVVPLEM